ncbi:hypothetical protein HKCCE4037_19270 [Rhodobacterales bacterium HKCCE4037]|nr:hypothetical protein [Rhodobacterales bacterium HKCCE4037]
MHRFIFFVIAFVVSTGATAQANQDALVEADMRVTVCIDVVASNAFFGGANAERSVDLAMATCGEEVVRYIDAALAVYEQRGGIIESDYDFWKLRADIAHNLNRRFTTILSGGT